MLAHLPLVTAPSFFFFFFVLPASLFFFLVFWAAALKAFAFAVVAKSKCLTKLENSASSSMLLSSSRSSSHCWTRSSFSQKAATMSPSLSCRALAYTRLLH